MVFRSGGILRRDLTFLYDGQVINIVQHFTFRKAMLSLNKYLHKSTQIIPKHYLDIFDKFIKLVLQYGSEVWGFSNANILERVHLQICKQVSGIKRATQNDFIYGE